MAEKDWPGPLRRWAWRTSGLWHDDSRRSAVNGELYIVSYSAKVAASLAASLLVAFLIQLLTHLRLTSGAAAWRLAPEFWSAMTRLPTQRRAQTRLRPTVCVVVQTFSSRSGPLFTATALVGLGYLCWKLNGWVERLLVTFGAYALALYTAHAAISAFGPTRAMVAGGIYVAVSTSTALIQTRIDGIFANRLQT